MIKYVELSGYKSILNKCRIDLSGITILSGANSSGKSSFMQPLLLMKQTLECSYDPGVMLLDGPNTKITATDQIISKIKSGGTSVSAFDVVIGFDALSYSTKYRRAQRGNLRLEEAVICSTSSGKEAKLKDGTRIDNEILAVFDNKQEDPLSLANVLKLLPGSVDSGLYAIKNRCFLTTQFRVQGQRAGSIKLEHNLFGEVEYALKGLLHIPGLRGNPERTYTAGEVGNRFPGTYENYIASIVLKWQEAGDEKLVTLGEYLRLLGLSWKLAAKKIQDTRVELLVGRLPKAVPGGAKDLVSLADVGLGVAQILPILVALISAGEGQLVYIEQPELHLHPRAQWKLSEILRDAVGRGVKIIIETHSSVLIKGLQTQIAARRIKPGDVSLNWFTRDAKTGATIVNGVKPDASGALGDWPGDFDEIGLEVESAYLDAVIN